VPFLLVRFLWASKENEQKHGYSLEYSYYCQFELVKKFNNVTEKDHQTRLFCYFFGRCKKVRTYHFDGTKECNCLCRIYLGIATAATFRSFSTGQKTLRGN